MTLVMTVAGVSCLATKVYESHDRESNRVSDAHNQHKKGKPDTHLSPIKTRRYGTLGGVAQLVRAAES